MVEAAAGGMTSVTCIFPAVRFEELVEIDQWTNEMTAAFLGVRNPLIETLLDRLAREIMFPRDRTETVLDAIITLLTAELGHIRPPAALAARGDRASSRPGRSIGCARRSIRRSTAAWSTSPISPKAARSARAISSGGSRPGDTIHGYVRRLRLDRAKMLAGENAMLKDIAAELGFKTPSHFAAEFRQRSDCSPSEYRARLPAALRAIPIHGWLHY